jgi:hypothetical protein
VVGVRNGFLELAATDRGSGVDPLSFQARIDGDVVPVSFASGRAHLSLSGIARGRRTLTLSVSDFQETKNMENIGRILPNTRTVRTTFVRP